MAAVFVEQVLSDIEVELSRARQKFPKTADTLPALMEEVGELSQALIQQKHEPLKGKSHEHIYREAIQVAVMAIRIATEGDANFPAYDPESGYRGPNWPAYKRLSHVCGVTCKPEGEHCNGYCRGEADAPGQY